MSISTEDHTPERDILYLNFNQYSTALSVGTKTGYMVYDFHSVYDCRPTYESRNLQDICIIERNYGSSLAAYVCLDSPRLLVLYNYTKGVEISHIHFPNTILSVKLNRKNFVVCLEDTIFIYYLMDLSDGAKHLITNVPSNVKGLIAISYGNGNTIIAYPVSSASGDVQIFDATVKKAKTTIPAHTSQIAALALDEDGEKLATASIKGTVIRVFSVADCKILFDFRRGVKRCVEIHSLSFDISAEYLCASSNTETVHIFKLCAAEPSEPVDEENEGWMEMFGRVLSQSAKYLPTQVTDVLTQQRSFAIVHLPFFDQKTVCAISKIHNVHYVIVASYEGLLYIYELNTEVGGSCQLIKQHKIEGPFEKPNLVENKVTNPHTACLQQNVEVMQPIIPQQDSENKDSEDDGDLPNIHTSHTISEDLPPLLNQIE